MATIEYCWLHSALVFNSFCLQGKFYPQSISWHLLNFTHPNLALNTVSISRPLMFTPSNKYEKSVTVSSSSYILSLWLSTFLWISCIYYILNLLQIYLSSFLFLRAFYISSFHKTYVILHSSLFFWFYWSAISYRPWPLFSPYLLLDLLHLAEISMFSEVAPVLAKKITNRIHYFV